jgi:hypothetical protein
MPSSDLDRAIEQIVFARGYTVRLLDSPPRADWFRMPAEGVSHVAWQVGHLAMAQYRLALERIRGQRPEDSALIADDFLRAFARESVPTPDATRYPSPEAIRTTFNRVHEQVLRELPAVSPEALTQPPEKPHSLAQTKRASLLWCAQHELVHAGQIGLLRRLLGYPPLW